VLHAEMVSLNRAFPVRSVKCSGRESGVPLYYYWQYILAGVSVDTGVPVMLWRDSNAVEHFLSSSFSPARMTRHNSYLTARESRLICPLRDTKC